MHGHSRYSVNTYWMLVSELIYQTLTVVFKLVKYIAWNCWPTGSRSDWALLVKLVQPDPSLLTVLPHALYPAWPCSEVHITCVASFAQMPLILLCWSYPSGFSWNSFVCICWQNFSSFSLLLGNLVPVFIRAFMTKYHNFLPCTLPVEQDLSQFLST